MLFEYEIFGQQSVYCTVEQSIFICIHHFYVANKGFALKFETYSIDFSSLETVHPPVEASPVSGSAVCVHCYYFHSLEGLNIILMPMRRHCCMATESYSKSVSLCVRLYLSLHLHLSIRTPVCAKRYKWLISAFRIAEIMLISSINNSSSDYRRFVTKIIEKCVIYTERNVVRVLLTMHVFVSSLTELIHWNKRGDTHHDYFTYWMRNEGIEMKWEQRNHYVKCVYKTLLL